VVAAVLRVFGQEVKDPYHLIPDYVVMSIIVVVLLSILLGLFGRRLQLVPTRSQVILESLIDFFEGLIDDTMGLEGRKYLPLVASVGLFILTANSSWLNSRFLLASNQ